jgi:hypothetical protein
MTDKEKLEIIKRLPKQYKCLHHQPQMNNSHEYHKQAAEWFEKQIQEILDRK